ALVIGDIQNLEIVVSGFYRNTMDLGFWREMVCNKTLARGHGGCRVRNWTNETDKAQGRPNLGTVAMTLGADGFTEFYVFNPDGLLTPVAKLDTEGFKAAPRLCTPCHSGHFLAAESDGNMGSIFREFEPSLLQARTGITAAQAEGEWFALNQAIVGANVALAAESTGAPTGTDHAKAATNAYIDEMYPNRAPPARDVHDSAHVP